MRIYTVVGDQPVAQTSEFKALAAKHDAMRSAYKQQEWPQYRILSEECRELAKPWDIDHYYELMLERVAEFEAAGYIENWNGVYIATSK